MERRARLAGRDAARCEKTHPCVFFFFWLQVTHLSDLSAEYLRLSWGVEMQHDVTSKPLFRVLQWSTCLYPAFRGAVFVRTRSAPGERSFLRSTKLFSSKGLKSSG